MINLDLGGGLCNRLRVMESGIRLAKLCDAPITIYWGYHPFAMRMFFSELFHPIRLNGTRIVEFRYFNPFRRWMFSRFNPRRFRESENNEFVKYCKDGNANKFFVAHHNYAEFCVNGLTRDYGWLKPLPYIQAKIDDAKNVLGKKYIGIHIRRTDNTWSIENSPLSLFKDKIEIELKQDASAKFFLATDDEETKMELVSKYSKAIYTCENVAERNAEGGVADAVVDLMLLAGASKVIGSFGSSFSVVASQIGNIPLEVLKKESATSEHDERFNWEHPQTV